MEEIFPDEPTILDGPTSKVHLCKNCGRPTGNSPICLHDGQIQFGGHIVNERYELGKFLGAGGAAFVYSAQHLALGKKVAIKVLRPELASEEDHSKRFLREARISSKLEHENIVRVMDFGETLNLPFLVMDYVHGPSLAQVISAQSPMKWDDAIPLLQQLSYALASAHQQGVVHRDLTPRNILLAESSGRLIVKLCDFGLSRIADDGVRITTTGSPMGTPAYMAPEQIRGSREQDFRVDLYSFGVIAYEMLSGRLPHEGSTVVSILSNRLNEPPTSLDSLSLNEPVPQSVSSFVMKCLALEPLQRPSSSQEIDTVLRRVLDGGHTSSVKDTDEPELSTENLSRTVDLIGTPAGNFIFKRQIGEGGMGAVYMAEHPVIGTQVAVKVIRSELAASEEAFQRFVREAKATSAIESADVPRFLDFGKLPDGRAFAVMDLLQGESLGDWFEREGCLSSRDTIRIIKDVALTMSKAHDAGILHRDLKPENIFIDRSGDVATTKVLDFGIAKLMTERSVRTTAVGMFVGSPSHCAPEQAASLAVDERTDIYALGSTAFELLTGRPPFNFDNPGTLLREKLRKEAPNVRSLVPEIEKPLASLIAKMIRLKPNKRPLSMLEVVSALQKINENIKEDPSVRTVRPQSVSSDAIADTYVHKQVSTSPSKLALLLIAMFLVVSALVAAALLRTPSPESLPLDPTEVVELERKTPPPAPKHKSAAPKPALKPANPPDIAMNSQSVMQPTTDAPKTERGKTKSKRRPQVRTNMRKPRDKPAEPIPAVMKPRPKIANPFE